jgi:hypothetical protein
MVTVDEALAKSYMTSTTLPDEVKAVKAGKLRGAVINKIAYVYVNDLTQYRNNKDTSK